MHRRTKYSLVALLCLAPATVAAVGASNNALSLQPQSRLWVEGTSTVRDYQCRTSTIQARIATTGANATSAVMAGERAVTSVEVRVPARQLDCANATMNEHMLRALKASEHPEITFRLSSYELSRAGQGMQVRLNGSLNLGGVQKPVSITANARDAGSGMLQVVGSHEIRMSEYGLQPPTLMMGTLKVNERVKVNFDLLLKA